MVLHLAAQATAARGSSFHENYHSPSSIEHHDRNDYNPDADMGNACIKSGTLLRKAQRGGRSRWAQQLVILTESHLRFKKVGVRKEDRSNGGTSSSTSICGEDQKTNWVLLDTMDLRDIQDVSQTESEIDDDGEDGAFCFVIKVARFTSNHAYNAQAHTYYLQAATEDDLQEWMDTVKRQVEIAIDLVELEGDHYPLARQRRWCRQVYRSAQCQTFFGVIIIASWFIALVDAELLPQEGTTSHDVFKTLEALVTGLFTLELSFNFFGSWFWPFLQEPWNIFDTLVVAVSIIARWWDDMPHFALLRLFRCFRLVRLVKSRVPQLDILLKAIAAATVPVLYSFLLFLVVVSIFAIICTRLYGNDHRNWFGSLSRSFFTLFQMATGTLSVCLTPFIDIRVM